MKSMKLLMGPRDPLATPGKVAASGIKLTNQEVLVDEQVWTKLEEMLVQASRLQPFVFKPAVALYTAENLPNVTPTAIINEPVQISIKISNPLQIILNLKNIYLLWEFEANEGTFSNENKRTDGDAYVKTHLIKAAILQATSEQELVFAVTPLATGILKLQGICYCLISSNNQLDVMQVRGRQLFDTKSLMINEITIKILPPAPCLQAYFTEIYSDVLCNEIQKVTLDLLNVSSIPLHNVFIATSVPHLISACEFQAKEEFEFTPIESTAVKEKLARRNHVIPVLLPEDKLESNKSTSFNLWLKAPSEKGTAVIDLLIYYENVNCNSIPRYRLVRHIWKISVQESIGIEVIRQQSATSTTTEKLALSLKVTNLNKVFNTILTEVSLLKVALLSSYWFLLNEVLVPKKFTLNSQETVYNVIKFKRKIQKEILYSELPLQRNCLLPQGAGSAYLDFAERNNEFRVNIFEEMDVGESETWKVSEGVLIVQWEATVVDAGNKRKAYGQSQIVMEEFKDKIEETSDYDANFFYDDSKMLDSASSKNKENAELEKLQKQLTYNLLHPADVCHNFRNKKVCIVPVKLMLHSIVGDTSLNITVNTLEETG